MGNANCGAIALDDVRGRLAIIGVGESRQGWNLGRSRQRLSFDAIDAALDDAGLLPGDIDGLMVSGMFPGQLTPALFREHYGTGGELWFSASGGAFSYAATAPHEAALAIEQKRATNVVNVFGVDWGSQHGTEGGDTPGRYHIEDPFKSALEVPYGFIPQPVYFAATMRRHMHDYGTTPAQFGAIAVSQRRHAAGHPDAVLRDKPLSLDQYLDRRPFIDPLRLEDCCIISDGAAAVVMTARERARDGRKRPVIVEGVGSGRSEAGAYFALEPDFLASPQRFSGPGAFAMAGVRPADVDVLEIYDPFTIAALIQIEDLGFCAKGEGGAFVEGGRLDFDRGRRRGGLPTNTHGGLLSHAYILGLTHVVELVRQLRGEAANQVADAELGVFGSYTGISAGTLILSRGQA